MIRVTFSGLATLDLRNMQNVVAIMPSAFLITLYALDMWWLKICFSSGMYLPGYGRNIYIFKGKAASPTKKYGIGVVIPLIISTSGMDNTVVHFP